jgi:hypothetical protein
VNLETQSALFCASWQRSVFSVTSVFSVAGAISRLAGDYTGSGAPEPVAPNTRNLLAKDPPPSDRLFHG